MKILIIRTDAIGDTLLSLPLAELIKKHYPDAEISILLAPYTKELAEDNPYISEILLDDYNNEHKGFRGFWRLVEELKEKKFDWAILLHPTTRLALLIYFAGIPNRLGTGYRSYAFLFNHHISEHRSKGEKHELEFNINMLRALNIQPEYINPKFYLNESARKYAKEKLESWNIKNNKPFIVFHPGSGGSARDWNINYYAKLADILIKNDYNILITGTTKEKKLINNMLEIMEHNPLLLIGETNLKQLGAILEQADLIVSNSTGPMHLATAVGTRALAIFCPIIPCTPRRWGPYGEGHIVLIPPDVPECPKCIKEHCPYWDCMRKITIEKVRSEIEKILGERY